jgi:phage baseplate assembly protein W
MEKSLYNRVTVPANQGSVLSFDTRSYRGLSTVSNDSNSFALYDINLIKQDLINHFHIRLGEKLENPTFGTIIWDLLFDPMTEDVKTAIAENVKTIINNDPRVKTDKIIVSAYDTGIQIECELTYLPYNIAEAIKFKFDQDNNIFA